MGKTIDLDMKLSASEARALIQIASRVAEEDMSDPDVIGAMIRLRAAAELARGVLQRSGYDPASLRKLLRKAREAGAAFAAAGIAASEAGPTAPKPHSDPVPERPKS